LELIHGSTNSRTTSRTKPPASFEPGIDYVVTKIPRFAFEKFPQAGAGARPPVTLSNENKVNLKALCKTSFIISKTSRKLTLRRQP
jgi:hypothetical protein